MGLVFAWMLGGLLCFFSGLLMADTSTLSIVYPDVGSPYAKVFEDISDGVKEGYKGRTRLVAIKSGDSSQKTKQRLLKNDSDVIVSLGSSSLKAVKSLDIEVPVIAGAVVKNGGPVSGISMVPDGALLVDILVEVDSRLRNVYTLASNPSSPLVTGVAQRLNDQGRSLEAVKVTSYKEAAIAYRDILSKAKQHDAIWLMPGARYLDNTLFTLILEAAWKKELVVFSSNPSHVSRGALFAVYPNNRTMGMALGEMANEATEGKTLSGLQSLKHVYVGVNQRTAKHLDIVLDDQLAGEAELVVLAH